MEKWKEYGRRLLYPPGWLIWILAAVSSILLTSVFFYTLTVTCAWVIVVFPKKYRQMRQRLMETKYGNRYLTDVFFKTHVSLYRSLAVNLLYVGFNLLSYYLYRSMWFVVLGVYYGILAVMRFLLLRYAQKYSLGSDRISELKRARLCAGILLTLNFFLSGAVLMILYQNKGFEYHGMLIYVMAAYTFYAVGRAIVDLVKYRKYKSPVMTISKNIALSAALVSVLALETAMFSQFGADMSLEDQRLMIALTGAGVSVAVIAMSAYMIFNCTKEMRQVRQSGQRQEDQGDFSYGRK